MSVRDLSERVDDWGSLKVDRSPVDRFGDLLRCGQFTIVKNDTGRDSEREVCGLLSPMEQNLGLAWNDLLTQHFAYLVPYLSF